MESSILKSRAALALNEILATDHVDYRSFERSRLCFYIQDYHSDVEKEVALALAPEWEEIKNYDRLSFLKRLLIRLRFTWKSKKAELVLSDEIVESIVDLMLPDIISFFESEEGKKEFEEWKIQYRANECKVVIDHVKKEKQ